MIDLHTHSSASDGELPPGDLVNFAADSGITALALTDHNTVSGLEEAKIAAANRGIKFIPGIELNIDWPKGEFHLLGLDLQEISPKMEELISEIHVHRDKRNAKITSLIQAGGFDFDFEEFRQFCKTQCIGRPHFARFFEMKGWTSSYQKAFDKFFAMGKPFYVKNGGCPLLRGIDAIKSCGGKAVLAHPMSLYISRSALEQLCLKFKDDGIEGLGAFHSGAKRNDCFWLKSLAEKYNFFVTAGSDFHGTSLRRDRKIGCWGEDREITVDLLK